MASESWAYFGAKIAGKVVMNLMLPGSSLIIDGGEICYDFYNGNVASGTIGMVVALVDVATLGIGSAVASGAAKNGAIEFAKTAKAEAIKKGGKEAGKVFGKKLGREISKEIAAGTFKTIGQEGVKAATKTTLIDVFTTALNGVLMGEGIKSIVVETFETFIKYIIEMTGMEASKYMMEEALVQAAKNAAIEIGKIIKEIIIIMEGFKIIVKIMFAKV